MGCKWIRVRLIIYSANEINCVLNVLFSLRLETYPKGFVCIDFYFCSDLINQYQWRLHVFECNKNQLLRKPSVFGNLRFLGCEILLCVWLI
jgi:hypothetical protein